MIPLKKPKMQGAKFSRNEAYLAYVAWAGKLKQRRRLGFFSRIIGCFFILKILFEAFEVHNLGIRPGSPSKLAQHNKAQGLRR
jgi:hypothetical protein